MINNLNNIYMIKIKKLLKSRQFWVLVGIFMVNGVSSVQEAIPADMRIYANGFLGFMSIYFRIFPKQSFE